MRQYQIVHPDMLLKSLAGWRSKVISAPRNVTNASLLEYSKYSKFQRKENRFGGTYYVHTRSCNKRKRKRKRKKHSHVCTDQNYKRHVGRNFKKKPFSSGIQILVRQPNFFFHFK